MKTVNILIGMDSVMLLWVKECRYHSILKTLQPASYYNAGHDRVEAKKPVGIFLSSLKAYIPAPMTPFSCC